jgi:hypothetical protein
MTICELCGDVVSRRKRVDGRLVCWRCTYGLNRPKENIVGELNKLERELRKMKERLPSTPIAKDYTFNSAVSAVPPLDVLRRAILALNLSGHFNAFSIVLSDHYDFKAPEYNVDPDRTPVGAIACYHYSNNKVTSREKTITNHTAFHEFWHVLQRHGIVSNDKSEQNADLYAIACLEMLKEVHS